MATWTANHVWLPESDTLKEAKTKMARLVRKLAEEAMSRELYT